LEGQYGKLKSQSFLFSEQQLVDCSAGSEYGNYGCDGKFKLVFLECIENSLEN
jgi:hypothetical protein